MPAATTPETADGAALESARERAPAVAVQHWLPRRVVSGGQTGVDRAALDWAIARGLEHGGWCPRGRRAEDGQIPSRYELTECDSAAYRVRTRLNVRDSDATLVLNMGDLDGGTLQTVAFAQREGKPLLVVDIEAADPQEAARAVVDWLEAGRPDVLNVAGPRESKRPGVHELASTVLQLCASLEHQRPEPRSRQ